MAKRSYTTDVDSGQQNTAFNQCISFAISYHMTQQR